MTKQEIIDEVKSADGEWVFFPRTGPCGVLDALHRLDRFCEENGMECLRDFATKRYKIRLSKD